MTQEEFEPSTTKEVDNDHIDNIDRFTYDIRQRMVWFIQHFTGNKYCIMCGKVIRINKAEDTEDFDIHMNNHHQDEEIVKVYLEIWTQIKDSPAFN